MKKFIITTLGCKVNQYESETIANALIHEGWIPAEGNEPANEPADVCIINTCTVTQKASMQSRQAIRQLIRANPYARIIVTGCYAQIEPAEIKKIPGVHHIIGREDKESVSDLIGNQEPTLTTDNCSLPTVHSSLNRTRPFLKIQDGCNAFCTYCIVPHARGRSRSMPVDAVLQHIREFKKAGYREIVLTGIHLGTYGLDLSPPTNLTELLHAVHDAKPMDRIRLSSIEPNEITEEIIELAASSDMFCRHFHIPLQSGDDTILKQMHRPYTNRFFRDMITKIHEQIPDAAIGVDTLIGFPGEDDAAFEKTYATLQDLPVTYLHVFPFSPRKGTPAATYPDKVPIKIIKARAKKMRELGNIKRKAFYQRFIGKSVEVLVEGKRDVPSGLLKGLTSNYMPVFISGEDELKNMIVSVKVEGIQEQSGITGGLVAFGSLNH